MIKNYLVVALRNLTRYKAYNLINILGLAIGIACCILILLFVQHEFSFDHFHAKSDRIFRVLRENKMAGTSARFSPDSSGGITPAMQRDFPEVEAATRFLNWGAWVRYEETFLQQGFCLADPTLLQMFDIALVRGDAQTALKEPGSVLVSEQAAKRFFTDEDPLGKIISVDNSNYGGMYKITGIMRDMSERAHFRLDFMVAGASPDAPPHFLNAWEGWTPTSSWRPFHNYILLKEGHSPQALEAKLDDFIALAASRGLCGALGRAARRG